MKSPTLSEQASVLRRLLQVEPRPPHACPFYQDNATARLATCTDCADGSRPVKPTPENISIASKQSIPEEPPMLPSHILAVGEHHRLAGSIWWIGSACPAFEEVRDVQGVVIYNRQTHIFLTQEETTEAQRVLPILMGEG